LALQEAVPVQDIDVGLLQKTLQEEGMIIEADSIREYDDYDWLKGNQRYGDRYKRMYDAYEVDVSSL
jgi:hypothetical protein